MSRTNPLAGFEDEADGLDTPQPEAPEVRTKRVKVSVALHPRPYFALVDFCAGAAKVTGSRVTHVEVMRALVRELLTDADLRSRVTEQLRNGVSN